jgi:acyl-CoA thioester hydrolase
LQGILFKSETQEALMDAYSMPYEVHWTEMRYRFFTQYNLPPEAFDSLGVGPVYTSLIANFFREVRLGETLTITFLLAGLSPTGMRWKFHHDFFKANRKKAVTVMLEGAMLNLTTRQPTALNLELLQVFQQVPRSPDFEVMSESRWFR